jgi:hypothetical protein
MTDNFPNDQLEDCGPTPSKNMSHLVTDAVKDAFMEVDEEAPGGWQGWRMWDEMVRDQNTLGSVTPSRFDGIDHAQPEMSWSIDEGPGIYGVDPLQNATMRIENSVNAHHNQWNFAVFR